METIDQYIRQTKFTKAEAQQVARDMNQCERGIEAPKDRWSYKAIECLDYWIVNIYDQGGKQLGAM